MKLYNSLSRQVELLNLKHSEKVTFYSCGPTVYDNQQIGNYRTFVFYDTLKRALASNHYDINHIMNITDVGHLVSDADEGEDKLEKGAAREGKTAWQVAEYYIDQFERESKTLNILPPLGGYARATSFINEQIAIIKILIDKGIAYQTELAIYFDVTKIASYGELTGQKLADKEVAVRSEVKTDSNKRHPYDFGLWFFTVGHFANHSMRWPSPWGEGFPGWHLECSAIIHTRLGDPIDIHAGGVDLIGTHHTNEMAQTEAAFGHQLANYWVHGEHLLVEGQKMAKSLGNFYTLNDIVEKGFDPLALRLLYLQSHYRSQMNFTWEALEASHNRLRSLRALADLRWQPQPNGGQPITNHDLKALHPAISDDLNTPKALTIVAELEDKAKAELFSEKSVASLLAYLEILDNLFGLDLLNSTDINLEQKKIITDREKCRAEEDWTKADQLRGKLKEQGIEINDTQQGPIWSRA